MKHILAFSSRLLLVAAAVVCASGCAQPLMNLPEGLAGKAETYPVRGRQGLLLFEPQISFGPYRTVSIHRGLAVTEQTSVATGAGSSVEHDSSRQPFDFVLQGPGSGAWRGSCVASSDVEIDTHVVGIHAGTNGSGFDREQTPVSSTSGYVCQLDGPDAEHWELEADEQLSGGTVRDAAGALIVGIQGMRESWTWKHPALDGDTLVSPAGDVWAAVQRSFDGAVYLSRELDPGRQAALAAICSALLIVGH